MIYQVNTSFDYSDSDTSVEAESLLDFLERAQIGKLTVPSDNLNLWVLETDLKFIDLEMIALPFVSELRLKNLLNRFTRIR